MEKSLEINTDKIEQTKDQNVVILPASDKSNFADGSLNQVLPVPLLQGKAQDPVRATFVPVAELPNRKDYESGGKLIPG